jgi:DNA-binding transcriptional regulator GbsR (MarR family)
MNEITEEMSEQYANWILTECSTPIDEIQYLVSEVLSNRNEEEKKKHLTESINEVIQWIKE